MLSPKTASQPVPTASSSKLAISSIKSPTLQVHADDDFGPEASSEEEDRTHSSVLSRHMRKRRRTNSALMSAVPSSPFSPSSFSVSPPGFDFSLDEMDDKDNLFVRRRKGSVIPQSDVLARQRCYEYLHTAIDAVWAEYCNSTSYAENQKYMPHSPTSDSDEFIVDDNEWAPLKPNKRSDSISLQPQSQSLMKQKKRLTNAKDLLAHFVSVPEVHASHQFWKTWDLLKNQIVELVEGEIEDDEYEDVIRDLEAGRC